MTATFQFQSLAAIVLVSTVTNNTNGRSSVFVAAQNNAQRPVSGRRVADRAPPVTCPQSPSLHCKNGSQCEEGIANFGRKHDHLGLQTHEGGYYCKCLAGFIGHECGIEVDDCEGDTGYNPSDPTGTLRSCYHGSQCRSSGDGGDGIYCDCAKLNKDTEPTAKKYAGMLCQHESTSLCAASLVGEHAPNQQFCTNHGKCVKMVTGGDPHPGCVCREGYAGDRCEVWIDPVLAYKNDNPPQGTNSILGKVLFGVLMTAIIGTLIAFAVIYVKSKKGGAADADGAATTNGRRSATKSVVDETDLDPNGSGTLGSPSANTNGDADGHLELSRKKEDSPPAEASKEDPDDSEEPEIV